MQRKNILDAWKMCVKAHIKYFVMYMVIMIKAFVEYVVHGNTRTILFIKIHSCYTQEEGSL